MIASRPLQDGRHYRCNNDSDIRLFTPKCQNTAESSVKCNSKCKVQNSSKYRYIIEKKLIVQTHYCLLEPSGNLSIYSSERYRKWSIIFLAQHYSFVSRVIYFLFLSHDIIYDFATKSAIRTNSIEQFSLETLISTQSIKRRIQMI